MEGQDNSGNVKNEKFSAKSFSDSFFTVPLQHLFRIIKFKVEMKSIRLFFAASLLLAGSAYAEAQTFQISYTEHTDVNGNYTSDQVFILNPWELKNYFRSDSDRAAGATDYAEARGVYEYSNGNCWYWAAEAGADRHYARYVNCEGVILEYGMLVFNNSFGVRPAIWVEK